MTQYQNLEHYWESRFKDENYAIIFVRLGSRSPDEFIQILNKKNEVIQNHLLSKILELTKTVDVKVMMGDSTITEQKTFDPQQIINYLEKLNQKQFHFLLTQQNL